MQLHEIANSEIQTDSQEGSRNDISKSRLYDEAALKTAGGGPILMSSADQSCSPTHMKSIMKKGGTGTQMLQ